MFQNLNNLGQNISYMHNKYDVNSKDGLYDNSTPYSHTDLPNLSEVTIINASIYICCTGDCYIIHEYIIRRMCELNYFTL